MSSGLSAILYQLDLAERKIISNIDFQGRVADFFWFIFTVVGFLSSDGGETGAGPLTRTYLTLTAMLATKCTCNDKTRFQLRSHSQNSKWPPIESLLMHDKYKSMGL